MHGGGVLLLCVYLRLSLICDGVPVSCDRKVTLSPASRSVNDLMVCLGVSVLSPPREFPMCDQGCRWSCRFCRPVTPLLYLSPIGPLVGLLVLEV